MSGLLVPAEVVRMNLDANGEAGRAWLAELPGIVGELRERWSLTAMGPAFEGGRVGFVAPVERADETRAVLKISYVDDETRHEGDALAFWDGAGAVRLLDADPVLGALLLERLEPGTSLFDHPNPGEVVPLACGVLRRRCIHSPSYATWPSGGPTSCQGCSSDSAARSRHASRTRQRGSPPTSRPIPTSPCSPTATSTPATSWPPSASRGVDRPQATRR